MDEIILTTLLENEAVPVLAIFDGWMFVEGSRDLLAAHEATRLWPHEVLNPTRKGGHPSNGLLTCTVNRFQSLDIPPPISSRSSKRTAKNYLHWIHTRSTFDLLT